MPPKNKKHEPDRTLHYNQFLDFFYQVHYRLGMSLEAAMCGGIVSRTQAAILWILAFEFGEAAHIRRKDVELCLRDWFETSNSNVSKLLRDLAKPPLLFITQKESPHSGREKLISLTPAGHAFVRDMKLRGFQYFEEALAHMTLNQMEHGGEFFGTLFSRPLPRRSTAEGPAPRRHGASLKKRRAV